MSQNMAVIGAGNWGKNLVRNFHELGVLAGVYDINDKRREELERTLPGIRIFRDISEIYNDKRIQAVAVATPAATHYAVAKEAIVAGKDVFVEKPIALCYREGEEIVALARRGGRILMVGHVLYYHPAIKKLKEIIESGELGKIQYIYSNRLNLGKVRNEENILWSFAPHDISIILYLLGRMPINAACHGGNYLQSKIADVTMTNFDFEGGIKAHIFVSWLHPYKEQKLVVIGDKRMALFDDCRVEDKLLVYDHQIDWDGRLPVPRKGEARPVEIEKSEPLRNECAHFVECLETRKTPRTDGEEGLRVLRVLEACQESLMSEGEIVKIWEKIREM